jgi:hypothetical protein
MAAASEVSGSVPCSAELSSASCLARAASLSANLLRARLGARFNGAGEAAEFGEGGFCC